MKKHLLILIIIPFIFYSCTKNEAIDLNPNISSSNDVVLTSTAMQHVFTMLVKARGDSGVMSGNTCTIDNSIVTWNSGKNEFCFFYSQVLCSDSVVRTGKVKVCCNGDFADTGSISIVSFDHYNEDGNIILGNDTIVNTGTDAEGTHYTCSIMNGTMEKARVGTITFTSDFHAVVRSDKAILFSGTLDGISSAGDSFLSTMESPLTYDCCQWPCKGIIRVTVPSATVPSGTVDFIESDTCSYWMNYNINGMTIKVRKVNRSLQ